MKARVRPEKEIFLLYGLEEETEKGKKLRELLSTMGIETVTVTDDMLSETVEFCAGLPGSTASGAPYGGESMHYEMMVMQITRPRLNEVLTALHKGGLLVERKAVITPTNRKWSFQHLYKQVCEEHEWMTAKAKPGQN